MWQLKYNSGYSLFFEYTNNNSYFREKYDVFVDNELVIKGNTTNTFSLYNKVTGSVTIKIISKTIEFEKVIKLVDTNYFVNVSNYLRSDDYKLDMTNKLQALILSTPENTTLYFPAAKYKISSLFLKSNLKLVFETGVEFDVTTNRDSFPIIPGIIEDKQFAKEECLSSWEGNPQNVFSSVISGYNLANVEIIGQAKINGNGSYDNWWNNPKKLDIAWRPKTIFLNNCDNIIFHGLDVYNSPSWTIHPFYCDNIKFFDIYINNPKDSPNTDGINPESCHNIEINGCKFNLGDDCIAIKSGKVYMAKNHYKATENIRIVNCKMEHGHGAIVLGSEISCGVKHLEIENCYFNDTDRGLRVKTRRGRGEKSIIDDIVFKNIIMNEVRAPITINAFYRCDPDGNSDYVATKNKICLPADTPTLGSFCFDNIQCENIHEVICIAYGLPEKVIEKIEIVNSKFSFSDNSKPGSPLMMRDEVELHETLFDLLNINKFVINKNNFMGCNQTKKTFKNVNVVKDVDNEYCE